MTKKRCEYCGTPIRVSDGPVSWHHEIDWPSDEEIAIKIDRIYGDMEINSGARYAIAYSEGFEDGIKYLKERMESGDE